MTRYLFILTACLWAFNSIAIFVWHWPKVIWFTRWWGALCLLLLLTSISAVRAQGVSSFAPGNSVAVRFPQQWNVFHLVKIDVNQTLDNGTTYTASDSGYFADIGEMTIPLYTLQPGNNLVVAAGWYANGGGYIVAPWIIVTNVSGAGIELTATNGTAQYLESKDLQHWTTNIVVSPVIIQPDKPMDFFRTAIGTQVHQFNSTPLSIDYLTYQNTNNAVVSMPLPPMPR